MKGKHTLSVKQLNFQLKIVEVMKLQDNDVNKKGKQNLDIFQNFIVNRI